MASGGKWTVVFEDKKIIKNYDEGAVQGIGYQIDNDAFWNDSKWSNIWAVQYRPDEHDYNDTVEYRDTTPHATWTAANLGDFQTQFIDKWDAAHLVQLQADWDNNNLLDADENPAESESDKIARLGARPTSYSSS